MLDALDGSSRRWSPCTTFAPKYSSKRKAYLVAKDKKCLHYYFYFIDEEFGLCYLRVPTWAPFRLQFYGSLHNWLARQLQQAAIENHWLDNAFVQMGTGRRRRTLRMF
jgi:hypothetical protein